VLGHQFDKKTDYFLIFDTAEILALT
jgi:hypothetical protein